MKKTTSKTILTILVIILLMALLIVPFLFAKPDVNSVYTERNLFPPIFYSVMLLLSAAVLIHYVIHNKRKYLWILLLFVSVVIVNTGYLSLSLSSSLSEALLANRISYLGNVYLLLFLMLTIVNACGLSYRKFVIIILFSISTIMFLFSATQGYLDLFYRNVDFAIVDGVSKLIKDYGPMHTVYIIYILAYFLGIVGTFIYSIIKKKIQSPAYIAGLAGIGLINIGVWLVEQFIDNNIEFLALSYVITEIILLGIYNQLLKKGALDTFVIKMTFSPEETTEKSIDIFVTEADNSRLFITQEKGNLDFSSLSDEQLIILMNHVENSDKLTDREREVAVLLLKDLKRKEMASSLFISEDTVKTHTSHVFNKLHVANRKELQELAKEYIENEGK